MTYNIFFSPTGGTEKIVRYMGANFSAPADIDLSLEISDYTMDKTDFCIVGVPSFGGRVPNTAVQRLQNLHGNQTPALLIVTYGNRAYEDTLKELKDVLETQGFLCIGAAAIVTEHSIVHQIGAGRPAEEDYKEIDVFIDKVKSRLSEKPQAIEVPGNTPYKEYHVAAMQIQTSDNCTKCGLCAKKCPVHAIPVENPQTTDDTRCISCMRCVSLCPRKARKCDTTKIEMLTEKLKKICVEEKQNEFFDNSRN